MNNSNDNQPPTVLVDLYRDTAAGEKRTKDSYKGLTIHAIPGLHKYIESQFIQMGLTQKGLDLIELGAGSGAMTKRYNDLGFTVTAVDYVKENFKLSSDEANFIQCDCNQQFSNTISKKSSILSAIEIIEHLENPRNFLRESTALLKENGTMILTTPNIDCSKSKLDFLLEGVFNLFRDSSYKSSGHISPFSSWQLYKMFNENSLDVISHTTFGNHDYSFSDRPKAMMLQKFIKLISAKPKWGDNVIHVIFLKKNET